MALSPIQQGETEDLSDENYLYSPSSKSQNVGLPTAAPSLPLCTQACLEQEWVSATGTEVTISQCGS